MAGLSERRRFPRVVRGLSVKLSSDTFDLIAETQNVSAAGANCLLPQAIPVMTRVALMMLLPTQRTGKPATKRICCEGVVVRSERAKTVGSGTRLYATAIYFSNIKPADQKAIDAYVKQQLADVQRALESL